MKRHYQIVITERAASQIKAIKDKRVRKAITERIRQLNTDPEKCGKPLTGNLEHHYRIKVLRRWRVVYRVAKIGKTVVVVLVGIRKAGDKKDVYESA